MAIDDERAWAEVGGVDMLGVKRLQNRDHLGEDDDGLSSGESAVFLDVIDEGTDEGALQ